jgi:TetR/AcrR family transcriptional repressor of nem operon
MGRASRKQAALHHERIIETASRLFRERGLNGIGVAELMAAAGLTHGGFYAHFPSKDALAAEAFSYASAARARYREGVVGSRDEAGAALHDIIERYLSAAHRDGAGSGCPIAALAGDVAHAPADAPVRQAFAAGVRRTVDALAALKPSTVPDRERRDQALVTLAGMVGAVVLSRALGSDSLSDEILRAVREDSRQAAA